MTTRPAHCHGNCVNAPVGDPPYQQTFNLLCEGCRQKLKEIKTKGGLIGITHNKRGDALPWTVVGGVVEHDDENENENENVENDDASDCPYPRYHASDCNCRGEGGDR